MKTLAIFLIVCFFVAAADTQARVRVHRYRKHNGTIVEPYYRTNPDHSKRNNWSSKGNVNPNTWKKGTVDPYKVKPYRNRRIR